MKNKVYNLTVKREISCAHKLTEHKGKCKNLHGHNYGILVEIETTKLLESGSSKGMIVDFGDVKAIIDELDHKYLNDLFRTKIGYADDYSNQPTSEGISEYLASEIMNLMVKDEKYRDIIVKANVSESASGTASTTVYHDFGEDM